MPRIRKKTSKRGTSNQRAKIKHKVAESHKKSKKAAKKNPQWKSKHAKDPGIPNSFPYKDQILAEVAAQRRQEEEEKQRRIEQKKAERLGAKTSLQAGPSSASAAAGSSASPVRTDKPASSKKQPEGPTETKETTAGDEPEPDFDGITSLESAQVKTSTKGKRRAVELEDSGADSDDSEDGTGGATLSAKQKRQLKQQKQAKKAATKPSESTSRPSAKGKASEKKVAFSLPSRSSKPAKKTKG